MLIRTVSFLSSLTQAYDEITCNQITLESPKALRSNLVPRTFTLAWGRDKGPGNEVEADQRLISHQIDHEKKCKQVIRISRLS